MGHCVNQFDKGETVCVRDTGESVTVLKFKYIKNMKRFSYIVKEHPKTFFFEEELEKM